MKISPTNVAKIKSFTKGNLHVVDNLKTFNLDDLKQAQLELSQMVGKEWLLEKVTAEIKIREDMKDPKRLSIKEAVTASRFYQKIGKEKKVGSNKELSERIDDYFKHCEDFAQLPTYENMLLSIGFTPMIIDQWYAGNVGSEMWVDGRTLEIIENGVAVISAIDSQLAQTGATKEKTYMFRSRNFYGMSDKKEVVISQAQTQISADDLMEEARLLNEKK